MGEVKILGVFFEVSIKILRLRKYRVGKFSFRDIGMLCLIFLGNDVIRKGGKGR